jgi:hypothetical protein
MFTRRFRVRSWSGLGRLFSWQKLRLDKPTPHASGIPFIGTLSACNRYMEDNDLKSRLNAINARFSGVDARLEKIDAHLLRMEAHIAELERLIRESMLARVAS